MPANSDPRPPARGVEFSDHLIVLGSSKPHQPQIAASSSFEDDSSATPFHASPSLPYRPPPNRRARFLDQSPKLISHSIPKSPRSDDDPVETSCTDSEEDHASYPTKTHHSPLQQTVEQCTRVNTKLNSLPSGGAFSLMNSSEDVDLSSSDDEQLTESRRLIRVHGSAKLSSASGLHEESLDIDDDEFAIEGAEKVDEEEAVNVRSFGRSFARVCLKDDFEGLAVQDSVMWDKERSQVAFDLPADEIVSRDQPPPVEHGVTSDSASRLSPSNEDNKDGHQVFAESQSVPPRRKSRLRLTFMRRASITDSKEPKREPSAGAANVPNVPNDSVSGVTRLSCFPMRKSPTKHRIRSGEASRTGFRCGTRMSTDAGTTNRQEMGGATHQVLAVPEFDLQKKKSNKTTKNRKMVKNISMQRDDWIDFATNSPHRQRSQWLSRLISHSGADSETSSRRESGDVDSDRTRDSRNSGWRLWRFWSRKQK